MKYVKFLNQIFKNTINEIDEFVIFGQNVSTGSCLGGLTHDFKSINGCKVYNTPNTENTLVGMGFGLMISGTPSALFLKQQDFLLLSIDQLRNTHNFIRQINSSTSFTIVNIVMDGGYEGIQSSLNNLTDICSISGCNGYTISSKQEAEIIIDESFRGTYFNIISVSQRLFETEILNIKDDLLISNSNVIKYRQGLDLTIACFNFSLPQGNIIAEQLNLIGFTASLYNITAAHPISYDSILQDAKITRRLIIIDDSKSYLSISSNLEKEALRLGIEITYLFQRQITKQSYRPHSEEFSIDINLLIKNARL